MPRKSRGLPSQERYIEKCQAKKEWKNAKPRKSRRMPSQERVHRRMPSQERVEECQAKKE
jgi:hypothetical protein